MKHFVLMIHSSQSISLLLWRLIFHLCGVFCLNKLIDALKDTGFVIAGYQRLEKYGLALIVCRIVKGWEIFCVISWIDLSMIEPRENSKTAKIKKCIELCKNHIDEAGLAWNWTSSNIKFKVINGAILDKT